MSDLNQLLGTLLRALPDINRPLETLLRGLEAGEVTNFFLVLLLGILLFAIVYKMRGQHPRFTANAPTLLTSLGIFGTFVGIVIGLLDFELKQINGGIVGADIAQAGEGRLGINQSQIIGLLEGLKIAFISSIAGLGSGLFFRFLTTTSLFPESEGGDEDPKRILVALNKQTQLLETTQEAIAGDEGSSLAGQVKLWREEQRHAHKEFTDQLWQKFAEQTQLLEATQNAIAGTEESSLVGQVMLLREAHGRAHQEFRDQLWQKFDEFAKTMSQSATEQVIEALQKVITDFNKNFTEQFGDNFKELNAAVKELVEWQENYRKQLEQLHKLYEESTEAIRIIEQRCALIPQSMEQLEPIIKEANRQMDKFEPIIEMANRQMDKFESIIETANRQMDKFESIIGTASRQMDKFEPIIETANRQSAELGRHLVAFAEMRDKATKAIPEVSKFSSEMHTAVTERIQEMGTYLGQISSQFAKDYEKHIKAMADVIERAKAFSQERGDNQ